MLSALLGLAGHLLRSRALRSSVLITASLLLVVSGAYATARALTLSPEQSNDRALGSYDASANLPDELLPGELPDIAVTSAAPEQSALTLSFQVDAEGGRVEDSIVERPWAAGTWGASAQLVSGRWPEKPGEVLVGISDESRGDGPIPILSGAATLTPVGRYRNAYAHSDSSLLAAPGTWAALPAAALESRAVQASQALYWSDAVAGEAEAVLAAAWGGMTPAIDTRDSVARAIPSYPFVGIFPIFFLPLLGGLLSGSSIGQWHRRIGMQFRQLGIPATLASGALLLSGGLGAAVAAVLGIAVGWGLAGIARPVLRLASSQDLSPIIAFPDVWAGMGGLAVLGALSGQLLTGWIGNRRRRSARASRLKLSPAGARSVCRAAAGFGAVGVVFVLAGQPRPAEVAMAVGLLVLVMVLLVPDIQWALTKLRTDALGPHLALQRVRNAPLRSAVFTMTLSAVIGLVAGAMTTMLTADAMMNHDVPSTQPPGTVSIGMLRPGQPLPDGMVKDFEEYTGLREPVIIRSALEAGQMIAIVTDADDAVRLLKTPVDPDVGARLAAGSALAREADPVLDSDGRELGIDLVVADFPFDLQYSHVMTVQGAEAAGLKFQPQPVYLYVDVTEQQLLLAQQAAEALGLAPTLIGWYRPADRLDPPASWDVWMAAFVLLVLGLSLVVTGAQSRELRPYLRRLNAVGAPRNWLTSVVLTEYALTVGLAVAVSLVITAAVIGLLVAMLGAIVVIPWRALITLFVSVALGGSLGAFLSARRLALHDDVRSSKRPTVARPPAPRAA